MVTGTLVADRQKKSKYSSEITEFQEKQRINVAFCALLTFSLWSLADGEAAVELLYRVLQIL